ncbi:16S rRNA (adenine(1518)-N(6)/adenine(1519)-N(6))-dimethyltransferase RsmA [Alphaproteobacteria bacterium]|nr:16S rRNA (adenine(1518)-N(6)/adenine(1519)-N(6))-dimethyltransferase RsmA [Alphaproteobacteria bacterium]
MSEDGLPPLRDVIRAENLQANKALGQNFLFDLNLTRRIARSVKPSSRPIIEIGPGPGALTRALLMEGAQKVICIEADQRFAGALTQIQDHYPGKLEILFSDALKCDLDTLTDEPYDIAANLPYNIGTPLLVSWLEKPWPPKWKSLTLMFQREVAQRLTAEHNTKSYGRLSVLTQWRNQCEILFDIPPEAFVPPPKITSSVVKITPMMPIQDVSQKNLSRLTAAAFNQRRKMLRSSLKPICSNPQTLLLQSGIEETRRGESLSIDEFCTLASNYETIISAQPTEGDVK